MEKEAPPLYGVLDKIVRTASFAALWTSVGKQRDLGDQVYEYLDDKLREVAESIEDKQSRDYFVEKSSNPQIRQYFSVLGQMTYITMHMAGILEKYKEGEKYHPAVAECAFNYGLDTFCQKLFDDYLDNKTEWPSAKKNEELKNSDNEINGIKTDRTMDDDELCRIKNILNVSFNRINNAIPEFSPENYKEMHAKRLQTMRKLEDSFLRYFTAKNDAERLKARLDIGDYGGEIEYYHMATSFKDYPKGYKKFQRLRGRAAAMFDDFKDYEIDKAKGLGYSKITRKRIAAEFMKEFTKSYFSLPFWSWDRNKYLVFNVLAALFHIREAIGVKAKS